jgi:hypothetical protein
MTFPSTLVELGAVIIAVTDESPRILVVPSSGSGSGYRDALPFGPLDAARDRTLGLAVRRWVQEQTGIRLDYIEQLYTFGDAGRVPGAPQRVVSVAYLALVREQPSRGQARWRDCYDYFAWEDWRGGRPATLDRDIVPALTEWVRSASDAAVRERREERTDITFGLAGAPWDGDRVLERYELLYEVGLVPEAVDGTGGSGGVPRWLLGEPMALDHRRIVATALGRLRGKLSYRPVVFELLPPSFTLLELQRLVEALAGSRLHKQNFRRLVVDQHRLVERTGALQASTRGRPAELFRFRREVLRERSTPGIGVSRPRVSDAARLFS